MSKKILNLLNISSYSDVIVNSLKISKPSLLFEKIEDEMINKEVNKLQKPAENTITFKPMIQYEDFTKLDLRVATIKDAAKVEKADRLLKITLHVGSQTRTVVSGIAEHYSPEEIIGKQVTYLANLAPRKLRGMESEGMILMAEDADGRLQFVSPSTKTADGSVIS